jgi:hypothetical protein
MDIKKHLNTQDNLLAVMQNLMCGHSASPNIYWMDWLNNCFEKSHTCDNVNIVVRAFKEQAAM